MHSIKKAVIRFCLVLAFIIAVQEIVRCCYQSWTDITFWSKKERKELEGTLDTLYCGTSLAYFAFNPETLDQAMGTNSFNLATASQPFIANYYLIRETVEKNPVKHIYLTISLPSLLKSGSNVQDYLSGFENMRSWKWKMAYLSAVNMEKVWLSSLLYTTQADYDISFKQMKKNVIRKYIEERFPEKYAGRGFRISEGVFKGRKGENHFTCTWADGSNEERLQEKAVTYLEKIVEFCKEKEIELTLIGTPYTKVFTDGIGNVDGFHQYMTGKAKEWGVDFFNFIYYKERFTVFPDEVFKDGFHLNTAGGEAFNEALIKVMQSEEPYTYFYDSVSEFEENEADGNL